MQHSADKASQAIKCFIAKLVNMSSYEQLGLAAVCLMTPGSAKIQQSLRSSLSYFDLFDRLLRKVLPPLIFVAIAMTLLALFFGPLSGLPAIILVASVFIVSLTLLSIGPAVMLAIGRIVTAYRDVSVYEGIRDATRDGSLYLGQLQHAGRILSSLPGNVNRNLDGFRILGAISDLISLAHLDPVDLSPSSMPRLLKKDVQERQVRSLPGYLSSTYGALCTALWSEGKPIASLIALINPELRPWVTRSDSGSAIFELLLNKHSVAYALFAISLTALTISVPIGALLFASGLFLTGFTIFASWKSSLFILPGTREYTDLEKSMAPLIKKARSHKTGDNLLKDLVESARVLGLAFESGRPIRLLELTKLASLIEKQATNKENSRWVTQLLFFPAWCEWTGTSLTGLSNRIVDLGPAPSESRADEALRFQGALTDSLTAILAGAPVGNQPSGFNGDAPPGGFHEHTDIAQDAPEGSDEPGSPEPMDNVPPSSDNPTDDLETITAVDTDHPAESPGQDLTGNSMDAPPDSIGNNFANDNSFANLADENEEIPPPPPDDEEPETSEGDEESFTDEDYSDPDDYDQDLERALRIHGIDEV